MLAAYDGETVIQLRNVTATGASGQCLTDVSVHVRGGEAYAVVGAVGQDPVVVADTVLGRARVTAGTVVVASQDVRANAVAARASIAVVATGYALEPTLSVRANVGLVLRLCQQPAPGPQAVTAALRKCFLRDARFDRPSEALEPDEIFYAWAAVAHLRDAPVVVAVHPTDRVGVVAARQITTVLSELKQAGRTLLIVSRDMSLATAVADRVALFEHGQLLEERFP